MIESIVMAVRSSFKMEEQPLIMDYSELLLRKFALNFKYIKYFQNNFSLSKLGFIMKWSYILDADLFKNLFEFINYCLLSILKYKNTSWDYYEKNSVMFTCKEFHQAFSLFINLLSLLYHYSLYYQEKDNHAQVLALANKFFDILENHRQVFDLFIHHSEKKFEYLRVLKFKTNLNAQKNTLFDLISLMV